jgi:hypothetical protein
MDDSRTTSRDDDEHRRTSERGDSAKPSDRDNAEATAARRRRRFVLLAVFGVVVLAAAGIYGWYYFTVGRYIDATDDAYTESDIIAISPQVSEPAPAPPAVAPLAPGPPGAAPPCARAGTEMSATASMIGTSHPQRFVVAMGQSGSGNQRCDRFVKATLSAMTAKTRPAIESNAAAAIAACTATPLKPSSAALAESTQEIRANRNMKAKRAVRRDIPIFYQSEFFDTAVCLRNQRCPSPRRKGRLVTVESSLGRRSDNAAAWWWSLGEKPTR